MEWISVDDQLPGQVIRVLVAKWDGRKNVKMHFVFIASRYGSDWMHDEDDSVMNPKYGRVTHWMPLPEVP
jgi:hypothetical protein